MPNGFETSDPARIIQLKEVPGKPRILYRRIQLFQNIKLETCSKVHSSWFHYFENAKYIVCFQERVKVRQAFLP